MPLSLKPIIHSDSLCALDTEKDNEHQIASAYALDPEDAANDEVVDEELGPLLVLINSLLE